MMKTAYLLTLNNLDGAACGVVMKDIWETVVIAYKDFIQANISISEDIDRILGDPNNNMTVIAGIPLNFENAEYVDERMQQDKILCVNNEAGNDTSNAFPWMSYDPLTSSSKLLFDELTARSHHSQNNSPLSQFLEFITLYELDQTDHRFYGLAEDLKRLFDFVGFERFSERSYYQALTAYERYALDILRLREKDFHFARHPNYDVDPQGNRFNWVLTSEHIEASGKFYLHYHTKVVKKPDYTVIVDPLNGGIHLFSRGDVDVGLLARQAQGDGTPTRAFVSFDFSSILEISFMGALKSEEKSGEKKC